MTLAPARHLVRCRTMDLLTYVIETGTLLDGEWQPSGFCKQAEWEDDETAMAAIRTVLRSYSYRLHHGDHVRVMRDGVELARMPIDAAFWTA